MKRFPLVLMLVAVAVLAAAGTHAQEWGVDSSSDMMAQARQDFSEGFWGTLNKLSDVLVDFIGRVLTKIAEAILMVFRGLGAMVMGN